MDNDNGWISVKDKLPEIEQKVIVGNVIGGVNGSAWRVKHLRYENVFDSNNWPVFAINEITHWMPLPSPPKTSDKD